MSEEIGGKTHALNTVLDLVRETFDAGTGLSVLDPCVNDQLTDYVERIIVHKGCGKPLTGMSPKNGWCMCLLSTGLPPEMKAQPAEVAPTSDEISTLRARCETAEKEVAKLTEKLDKASKRIAELVKKEK